MSDRGERGARPARDPGWRKLKMKPRNDTSRNTRKKEAGIISWACARCGGRARVGIQHDCRSHTPRWWKVGTRPSLPPDPQITEDAA
jgi:hypothetical protein